MPETIDLPGGHTAEIRTELNGADQVAYFTRRDELMQANGTARPAVMEPDPDNPAAMKEVPAVPARLTAADNFAIRDWAAARLLTSSTMPGLLPWRPPSRDDPGTRAALDLDVVNVIDEALDAQQLRLLGVGPKPAPARPSTSTTTSPDSAPAFQTGPPPPPSATAPGS